MSCRKVSRSRYPDYGHLWGECSTFGGCGKTWWFRGFWSKFRIGKDLGARVCQVEFFRHPSIGLTAIGKKVRFPFPSDPGRQPSWHGWAVGDSREDRSSWRFVARATSIEASLRMQGPVDASWSGTWLHRQEITLPHPPLLSACGWGGIRVAKLVGDQEVAGAGSPDRRSRRWTAALMKAAKSG